MIQPISDEARADLAEGEAAFATAVARMQEFQTLAMLGDWAAAEAARTAALGWMEASLDAFARACRRARRAW